MASHGADCSYPNPCQCNKNKKTCVGYFKHSKLPLLHVLVYQYLYFIILYLSFQFSLFLTFWYTILAENHKGCAQTAADGKWERSQKKKAQRPTRAGHSSGKPKSFSSGIQNIASSIIL
jgi:hypothetical protein